MIKLLKNWCAHVQKLNINASNDPCSRALVHKLNINPLKKKGWREVLIKLFNPVSLKKFYIIERELIKKNFLFIMYIISILFIFSFILNLPVLNLQEILSVFIMFLCLLIPKLRAVILNFSINSIWILLNLFLILTLSSLFMYIVGLLLHTMNLDNLFFEGGLGNLSLDTTFNKSKYIWRNILLFIMAAAIIKLALNSNNFKDFFKSLTWLLLALFNVAFFSLTFSLIFGGLILPVLTVLYNFIETDLGILKMDQNPQDEPKEKEIKQKCIKQSDYERKHPGKQNPNPRSGGDNCEICIIQNKLEARLENPDVNKNEKSNILHKFGKNYDLTGREGQKIRDVFDILRGEGYIIYKQPDLDPNKLTPQAAEANNNDFLMLKANEGKYDSLTNEGKNLRKTIRILTLYHNQFFTKDQGNNN